MATFTVNHFVASSGAVDFTTSGTTLDDEVVNSGGLAVVLSGGSVVGTSDLPFGEDIVSGGASAISTIVSFGALMFPGELSIGVPTAIWAMLIGGCTGGVWIALKTSLPPIATGIDSPTATVLVLLSATAGSAVLKAGGSADVAVETVMLIFTVATFLCGVVLFALASTTSVRWAVVVYTLGLTAMYTTRALYHRGHWSDATRLRLRRLDHSMIMVAIAATYTPVAVAALDVGNARVLLSVVWSLAVVGVVLQMVWLHAPRWLVAVLYIAIGWTALAFSPTLWRDLGVISFSLLIVSSGSLGLVPVGVRACAADGRPVAGAPQAGTSGDRNLHA